jgi:transcription initiation factor TFIID subunit TAF12
VVAVCEHQQQQHQQQQQQRQQQQQQQRVGFHTTPQQAVCLCGSLAGCASVYQQQVEQQQHWLGSVTCCHLTAPAHAAAAADVYAAVCSSTAGSELMGCLAVALAV